MSWQQRIIQALDERRKSATYRQRQVNQGGNVRQMQLRGEYYLNFSGNDYLGLSQDAQVIAAWQQGARQYGVGSGGSGHLTGFGAAHQAMEQQLVEWLGYLRALLFISGYAANQGLMAALMQAGDRILADRLSPVSLLEVASQSPALLRRFRHNHPQSLANLLAKTYAGQRLAVTEAVFSMDGDRAPLAELHSLTRAAGVWLMVDNAHGICVRGEQGRGSCWQQGAAGTISGDFRQGVWC